MDKRQTLCDYFDEDIVVRLSSEGRLELGLVVESSENLSDSDDDSDSDHSESDPIKTSLSDKWKKLKPGFTKIASYPSGKTHVINESKVKLYDRSLLSGDVVQRIDRSNHKLSQNSEHGFCKTTKIITTLRILGTDRVIVNVESNDIEMLTDVNLDTVCLLDSWVGYIKDIDYEITLKCNDGSVLVVSDIYLEQFTDLLTQRKDDSSEFSKEEYYIGQQLYGPKRRLKKAKWITKTKKMTAFMNSNSSRDCKINLVVEDITAVSVLINWLYCLAKDNSCDRESRVCDSNCGFKSKNSTKNSSSIDMKFDTSTQPKEYITGEAIKRITCLNYFGKCSLQLGHQCYYTIKQSDNVIKFSEWEKSEFNRLNTDSEIEKSRKSSPVCEGKVLGKSGIYTNCVSLKNDSMSDSLSSISSFESITSKNKKRRKKKSKFSLPLKQIKKKKLQASHRMTNCFLPINTNVGSRLPVEIVATNTLVTIVWQNGSLEEDVPSIFLYPVHHIDEHDFYPGDFVVQNKDNLQLFDYGVVQKSDFLSRISTIKWFTVGISSESAQFIAQEDVSVYDIKDHPDFNYRSGVCVVRITKDNCQTVSSRVGQVIDVCLDGMLTCVWANNQTSNVYPQELIVIGEYDSDDLWDDSESEYEDYSISSGTHSWISDSDNEEEGKTLNHKKSKKGQTSKNRRLSSQAVMDFIRNSATHLEEWLKNGSNDNSNNLRSVLDKIENDNGMSQNQRPKLQSVSVNKIHNLSKRVMNLMPFLQTFRQNCVKQSDSPSDNTIDNGLPTNQRPSTSSNNIQTFIQLLSKFKSEVLNNDIKADDSQTANHCVENDNQLSNPSNCSEVLTQNESCDHLSNTDPEKQNKDSDFTTTDNESDIILSDMSPLDTTSDSRGNLIVFNHTPECHKYYPTIIQPKNPKEYLKRVKQELTLLRNSMPEGIDVAIFHDRIDLISVLVYGPKGTPYEDGLFLFDIQLPANYPNVPPVVHYISFCSDRLNPNLYENGKVCISLLGTWSGKGTEVWSANTSNLLQLIISIQGLILVAEPYYNEAGYQRQRGTTIASENSRLYNEMVVIKLIQSMTKLILIPPKTFEHSINNHIKKVGNQFCQRLEHWAKVSELCISKSITTTEELNEYMKSEMDINLPQFPLLPASYGFCLSLNKAITLFKETLQ